MKVIKNKLKEHIAESHPDYYGQHYTNQGKIKYTLSPSGACRFLEDNGFMVENGFPVRAVGNVVESKSKEDVFNFLLADVRTYDDQDLSDHFIVQGEKLFIKDRGTLLGMKKLNDRFVRDSKNSTYHFYRDCAILVTKEGFKKIEYEDLGGMVREEWIIKRNAPDLERNSESVMSKFDKKITREEPHRLQLQTATGYMLNNHKDPSRTVMVLFTAENPKEGGSGKDVRRKAIGQHVPICVIDGKRVDPEKDKFWNQNYESEPLLYIADMDRCDIRPWFNCITDGMEIEVKYRDKIVVPFEHSPKLLGSANSEYVETNAAYRRRSFIVRLTNFYNDKHTPIDDFGHVFFDDWDEAEWELFDLYMMDCSRLYLKHGLVGYDNEEFKLKSAVNRTSQEFWQCMTVGGFGKLGEPHLKNELRYALAELNPYYRNISHKKLKSWLEFFAEFHGYSLEEQRGTDGFASYVLIDDDLM